jgi:hypothetical protein
MHEEPPIIEFLKTLVTQLGAREDYLGEFSACARVELERIRSLIGPRRDGDAIASELLDEAQNSNKTRFQNTEGSLEILL